LRDKLQREKPTELRKMIAIANQWADADDDARGTDDPVIVVAREGGKQNKKRKNDDKPTPELVAATQGSQGGRGGRGQGSGKRDRGGGQGSGRDASAKGPSYEEWRNMPRAYHTVLQ
jgi:hypothetical protein